MKKGFKYYLFLAVVSIFAIGFIYATFIKNFHIFYGAFFYLIPFYVWFIVSFVCATASWTIFKKTKHAPLYHKSLKFIEHILTVVCLLAVLLGFLQYSLEECIERGGSSITEGGSRTNFTSCYNKTGELLYR